MPLDGLVSSFLALLRTQDPTANAGPIRSTLGEISWRDGTVTSSTATATQTLSVTCEGDALQQALAWSVCPPATPEQAWWRDVRLELTDGDRHLVIRPIDVTVDRIMFDSARTATVELTARLVLELIQPVVEGEPIQVIELDAQLLGDHA
jgi:hypothetical protein